jgi:hypothetical protein
MTITIEIKDLIFAIRDTSHNEVASIADVQARYKAEAGLEKIELIKQCILEAYSSVLAVCHRFLSGDDVSDFNPAVPDTSETIDGITDIGISDFSFVLVGGVRRLGAKGPALGNKIREALKDYALSSFYTSVSQDKLSMEHNKRAVSDLKELESMLRGKRPPEPYTPEPTPDPEP